VVGLISMQMCTCEGPSYNGPILTHWLVFTSVAPCSASWQQW